MKSAVTPVIFAQAAAICQQLGGGPDAFLFTQFCSMEKLFEVDAWASQVRDDVAAEAACSRAESLAYQADANAQAAADEMHTNSDASAAKKALDADADAWKIAENESIDVAATRGTADINAAKKANDWDAEADKDRAEQEAIFSAFRQEVDLTADHTADTRKVTANKTATISGANAGYDKLVAYAPANVILLKARVEADIDKARAEAARNSAVVVAGAAEDEKAANQKAEEVMSSNITKASDYLAQLSSQPLSSFEYGPSVRPFSVEWAMGPGLDGAVNFATGFMDGFTARGWSALLSQTGLLSYVDRDSMGSCPFSLRLVFVICGWSSRFREWTPVTTRKNGFDS